MKLGLIIALISLALSITALVWAVINWSRHRAKEQSIYDSFDLYPEQMAITQQSLRSYGFTIYDTKDQLYALHPNGISLTYQEGTEWIVNTGKGFGMVAEEQIPVHIMTDLIKLCESKNKPIKQEDSE
jgi:hypothetical protein